MIKVDVSNVISEEEIAKYSSKAKEINEMIVNKTGAGNEQQTRTQPQPCTDAQGRVIMAVTTPKQASATTGTDSRASGPRRGVSRPVQVSSAGRRCAGQVCGWCQDIRFPSTC